MTLWIWWSFSYTYCLLPSSPTGCLRSVSRQSVQGVTLHFERYCSKVTEEAVTWRWRQQLPPKTCYLSTTLHDVTAQMHCDVKMISPRRTYDSPIAEEQLMKLRGEWCKQTPQCGDKPAEHGCYAGWLAPAEGYRHGRHQQGHCSRQRP